MKRSGLRIPCTLSLYKYLYSYTSTCIRRPAYGEPRSPGTNLRLRAVEESRACMSKDVPRGDARGREGSTPLAMLLIYGALIHSANMGTNKNTNGASVGR
jgi:hypothetical protein